jgi:hypothetical protein
MTTSWAGPGTAGRSGLPDGGRDGAGDFEQAVDYAVDWKSGTRHAKAATPDPAAARSTIEPQAEFFMLGLGYGHPVWGHGLNHGN